MASELTGAAGSTSATVLFAQVCEGRQLERELGVAAAEELFEGLARELGPEATRYSGRVVMRVSAEILCTFPDPAAAALGAISFLEKCRQPNVPSIDAPNLSLRIGMHSGEVQLSGDRVSGPAVYRAKRITEVAKASQILVEQDLLPALESEGVDTRLLDHTVLRGQDESVELHEVIWNAPEATVVFTRADAREARTLSLACEVAGRHFELAEGQSLSLGRGEDCGVQLDEQGVSREHASLVARRGRYYLVDSSTNGSWVSDPPGTEPVFVRRDELRLGSAGSIGLGKRPEEGAGHTLRYRVVRE